MYKPAAKYTLPKMQNTSLYHLVMAFVVYKNQIKSKNEKPLSPLLLSNIRLHNQFNVYNALSVNPFNIFFL
ncbi:hypothetical protein FD15_GL002170 [Liquorilactobacillus sucicola DSM 21376 = JCM 15457]|uniref:Uncharacterized protein n=1 Tax=Liquorilactobacillus sucicola DSM 21376 = JCM 15457 TaxID=1423806 RepID=A0A0R2DX37_9LACO|nr:hypothetical protein FD15_GL002170 [Liquorilactobacillus sucicola DSM 21376 = JCM 15457]